MSHNGATIVLQLHSNPIEKRVHKRYLVLPPCQEASNNSGFLRFYKTVLNHSNQDFLVIGWEDCKISRPLNWWKPSGGSPRLLLVQYGIVCQVREHSNMTSDFQVERNVNLHLMISDAGRSVGQRGSDVRSIIFEFLLISLISR